MAQEEKMRKLQFARLKLKSDVKHAVESATQLKTNAPRLQIVCKDRSLEKSWADFQKNVDDIVANTHTMEDATSFFAENHNFEDEYHAAKVYLDTLLQATQEGESPMERTFFEPPSQEPTHSTHSRLPEIKLPPFDGKYDDWSKFSQMFTQLVTRERLDNIHKLYYLNQSLAGEPARLVKHLPVTDDSFDLAWELLKKTYEIRRHIVDAQFKLFFSITKIKSENVSELRTMLRICLECQSAFTALGIDAETMGLMMVYHCARQMDPETARQWEHELRSHTKEPKLNELIEFLQMRCRVLSHMEASSLQHAKAEHKPAKAVRAFLSQQNSAAEAKCLVCDGDHRTYKCSTLLNNAVDSRMKIVTDKRLCYNCLGAHRVDECKSRFCCSKCKRRHHSLLHFETTQPQSVAAPSSSTFSAHLKAEEPTETLLATARIPIHVKGKTTMVRAIIDQGSASNFVSERVCKLLKVKRYPLHTVIASLNNSTTGRISSATRITLGSMHEPMFRIEVEALITPAITSLSKVSTAVRYEWKHIQGLQLADPKCLEGGDVDILIGARTYAEVIMNGLRKGGPDDPIAQLTKFGWILSGACKTSPSLKQTSCFLSTVDHANLTNELQRFWELDEVQPKIRITNEDELCERKYVEGVSIAADGKIITRLPFKVDPMSDNFLGDSYNQAATRLKQLERRLARDETLYNMYREVLNEYIALGHMREATPEERADARAYFMPHHAVVKMIKTTSKVRVVFDASCKSTNGKSLNDQLMVGATIQLDLFSNILNWRKGRIGYTGDIEKMYRQFWVHPDDVKYQRILWRNSPAEPIKQYILLTVTFGTASAPFQAIRSLHYIADRITDERPDIARSIKRKFYVDDFLSSADTVEQALNERKEISETLKMYGLNITKWKSNSHEFQRHIPEKQQENVLEIADATCKALGILWQPQSDTFTFKLKLEEVKLPLTKRKIVSEVARLFDPLGWLTPAIVLAKLVIQQLWLEALDWDDRLPTEIQDYWLKLRKLLFQCDQIKLSRWVGLSKTTKTVEIHGFADASERAYAAVVYLRVVDEIGQISTHLLAAKSKVAPLQKVSVPRLELCAALMLTRLINQIRDAMELSQVPVYAYSDSTIVLSWLQEHPIRWQTFVANRVAEIQESLPASKWRHIESQLNPADCASRGKFIDELRTFDLWWHGPHFLQLSETEWPTKPFRRLSADKIPEQRKEVKVFHLQDKQENSILKRFSKLQKLLKFTAYALRWKNFRRTVPDNTRGNAIQPWEMERARNLWVRRAQEEAFPEDVHRLRNNKELLPSSKLSPLTPYYDKNGLLRVRGRIHYADLPYDSKHQSILPPQHHVTWLIIEDAHERTMHGGCQLTLQFLRQRYWLLNGRRTVSKQINQCVRCFRYKKEAQQQLMGDLPRSRLQSAHAFQFTGVDFAGYFEVKQSSRRNASFEKCYVCLFVCMVTKAIHLELAKDLSTNAFLDCYRCFIARRGIPERLYSDRGTNFIGACTEMPSLLYNAKAEQTELIINECLNSGTGWHFNPAHAPHFGGLWEAGVKSMKHHLRRVMHQTRFTEHQFRVIITQIEACLNSRPLCKLTESANDLEVLTPGHLAIGRAPNTLPEPSYVNVPENRLKMYQYQQRLVQEFWKQWHQEYLQSLQHRSKWTKQHNNIAVGQIVLLKEDNLPPSRWILGRVIKVTPGDDGLVRAVEVRCRNSIVSRAINKLCLLPTLDNELEHFSHTLKAGEHVDAVEGSTTQNSTPQTKIHAHTHTNRK